MNINYKESFEQIKIAGSLAADALDEVTSQIKTGITTQKIDKICLSTLVFNLIVKSDAQTIDVGILNEIPKIFFSKLFKHFVTAFTAVVFFGIKFEILSLPNE